MAFTEKFADPSSGSGPGYRGEEEALGQSSKARDLTDSLVGGFP